MLEFYFLWYIERVKENEMDELETNTFTLEMFDSDKEYYIETEAKTYGRRRIKNIIEGVMKVGGEVLIIRHMTTVMNLSNSSS